MIPQTLKKYFSPALLVYSKKEAETKMAFVNEHFAKSHLHVDVADGKFVPSSCWCTPADFKNLHIKQSFETHLMTLNPERRVSAWKRAGASRIVFHYEATHNPLHVIDTIKKNNLEAGIALNLETSTKHIELLLDRLDAILFMAIVPGFTGQKYHPEIVKKIAAFHKKHSEKLIIVDGGVSVKNASALLGAGARQLVSTSAVYGSRNYARK
ncbi:ribulose-phosphate 3-epimerase [Candidatus Uhrbacteria bacterium]|nr:ribulose-phosphate 3-epimerase [Candidatus Uhrbacteria bacterium]